MTPTPPEVTQENVEVFFHIGDVVTVEGMPGMWVLSSVKPFLMVAVEPEEVGEA